MKMTISATFHTKNTRIVFRPMFEKRFLALPKEAQKVITGAITTFAHNDNNEDCAKMLWILTYLHDAGFTFHYLQSFATSYALLYDKDRSLEFNMQLPTSLIPLLRNEMRYQRKKVHKNFMEPSVYGDCRTTYKKLRSALSDGISAFAVYQHCRDSCSRYSSAEIKNVLQLLKSKEASKQVSGITLLDFGTLEIKHLKPYAKQIGNFLDSFLKDKRNIFLYKSFEGQEKKQSVQKKAVKLSPGTRNSNITQAQQEKDGVLLFLKIMHVNSQPQIQKNKENAVCVNTDESGDELCNQEVLDDKCKDLIKIENEVNDKKLAPFEIINNRYFLEHYLNFLNIFSDYKEMEEGHAKKVLAKRHAGYRAEMKKKGISHEQVVNSVEEIRTLLKSLDSLVEKNKNS